MGMKKSKGEGGEGGTREAQAWSEPLPSYSCDSPLLRISWPVVYSRAWSVDKRIRCLHPVYCMYV